MAITSTTTTEFTVDIWAAEKAAEKAASAEGTNPLAELDSDDFLKLLLTELQYQDPTSPMDTEKMLEQTSQLTTLSTQQNTNKIMQELADSMQSSMSLNAMSALGKMANVDMSLDKTEGTSAMKFSLNFDEAAKSGTIYIQDNLGNVVKTFASGAVDAGNNEFIWDGTTNAGEQAPAGKYTATVAYTTTNGESKTSELGYYPVEAVKFENGTALVKIAGNYVDINSITEFTEPNS